MAALQREAFGDEKVGHIVEELWNAVVEGKGISLVAEVDDVPVGHVMLTPGLLDAPPRLVEVHVLSPLGVLASHRRTGVGRALVEAGLAEARAREVPVVFLEGDPSYYSRLGFVRGGPLGFRKPSLRIPDAAFQAYPLPAYEAWMTGTLVYPEVFWRLDAVGLRQ
jgi:putative acetyltransferase